MRITDNQDRELVDSQNNNESLEFEGHSRHQEIKRFSIILGLGALFLAMVPFLIAITATPSSHLLLGYPYNPDDHMVYAAWMRQSMDGHFFFDNRFTVMDQPGQTVHIYYWLLGKVANLTGILWASTLARGLFTFLFVLQLGAFVQKLKINTFEAKVAMTLGTFGMGIGYMVWESFGRIIKSGPFIDLLQSRLPIDVWQPEAFVFSSMLTNGLFMASLCLMLFLMRCVVDLQTSPKAVLPGALAIMLLMNIHSYDVLSLAIAWFVFLLMMVMQKQMTGAWFSRVMLMSAGVIPPAIWFMKVLSSDAVFQARAATPTYTAGFRAMIGGLGLLMVLAFIGLLLSNKSNLKAQVGLGLLSLVLVCGFVLGGVGEGFWLTWIQWIPLLFFVSAVAIIVSQKDDPAKCLCIAWALSGFVAVYAPVMFQRKMAAGISIPWAILAAIGIAALLHRKDRGERNMVMGIAVFSLCISSFMWLRRDLSFVSNNTSSTGTLPISVGKDADDILGLISKLEDKNVVGIAPLGAMNQLPDGDFGTPILPDLNPVLSGIGGIYSLAGHWSETPDYGNRREDVNRILLANGGDFSDITAMIPQKFKALYIITPIDSNFGGIAWRDFNNLEGSSKAEQLYKGKSLCLYKLELR